ncbi:Ig-like domain-containing protein [Methylohalobius crimeensis]|uniref:Ig-like domain-containing protein n=1 Tax=Methylohalobius crimeensis TaxID=244365 RepID=UPI0003B5094F|nr:Ig-like domain-containing protein [Methylohalobius crimeensis]
MRRWDWLAHGRLLQWVLAAVLVALSGFFLLAVKAEGPPPAGSDLLWIAESGGVVALDGEGEVRIELPTDRPARAVAFDRDRSLVWVLSGDELLTFDLAGQMRSAAVLPAPPGPSAELVVDAPSGTVWLGTAWTLQRFATDGTFQDAFDLPPGARLVGMALDEARSRLWLATRDALFAFAPDGTQTPPIAVSDPGPGRIGAIAFDRFHDALWVAGGGRVQRYDSAGERVFEATAPRRVDHLAADGQGGAWLATPASLHHLDLEGRVDLSLRPPKVPAPVRALVADPGDGTVWLAGPKRLRHYALDGTLLDAPEFAPDRGRRRLLADLARDPGPAVRVVVTAPQGGALTNQNPPPVELTVQGLQVAPERIVLTANTVEVAADCQNLAEAAFLCFPLDELSQGANEIVAAVVNAAGTRFASEAVVFELDSIPPAITIDQPPKGHPTNTTQIELIGTLSEAASLTVNGVPLEVGDDLRFQKTLFLEEGDNRIRLKARDPAGNVGAIERTVVLDTVPPEVPDRARISVTPAGTGQVRVTGDAGSVEPGSEVEITNTRSGKTVTVTAGADGSFSAEIAWESSDPLRLTLQDRAGNASPAVEINGTGSGGETALQGRLMDAHIAPDVPEVPVVGATVGILGSDLETTTDAGGAFTLRGIEGTEAALIVDATSAEPAPDGSAYAGFRTTLTLTPDTLNPLERPIFLPRIDPAGTAIVDPAQTTVVENPNLGVSVTIPPHTAQNPDGTAFSGQLSISEVPTDRTPQQLPDTLQPGLLVTLQPAGTRFSQPVPITFPNIDHLPPGSETDIWSLDETGHFAVTGRGRVSADGRRIETVTGCRPGAA